MLLYTQNDITNGANSSGLLIFGGNSSNPDYNILVPCTSKYLEPFQEQYRKINDLFARYEWLMLKAGEDQKIATPKGIFQLASLNIPDAVEVMKNIIPGELAKEDSGTIHGRVEEINAILDIGRPVTVSSGKQSDTVEYYEYQA
jgi:hypothetical protein